MREGEFMSQAKTTGIEQVPVSKLKPYENNAKKHSKKQIQQIADSITEFGFLNPCLIDAEYNIIAGHGRMMAAQQLGMETVPCIFVEGLTEAQRRAYILADNRLTELGEWDMDLVAKELEALEKEFDFNIDLTGFSLSIPEVAQEDDYEVVLPKEPKTKRGEIWVLGAHRLMCGDATDINDVEKLCGGGTQICT